MLPISLSQVIETPTNLQDGFIVCWNPGKQVGVHMGIIVLVYHCRPLDAHRPMQEQA